MYIDENSKRSFILTVCYLLNKNYMKKCILLQKFLNNKLLYLVKKTEYYFVLIF